MESQLKMPPKSKQMPRTRGEWLPPYLPPLHSYVHYASWNKFEAKSLTIKQTHSLISSCLSSSSVSWRSVVLIMPTRPHQKPLSFSSFWHCLNGENCPNSTINGTAVNTRQNGLPLTKMMANICSGKCLENIFEKKLLTGGVISMCACVCVQDRLIV